MIDEFGFEDEGRTFTCYVAVSHQSRPDPWWWFSVSNDDRHKYAPFRAVRGDTKASVKARILAYYRELLIQRAAPPVPYWRRGGFKVGSAAKPPVAPE